MLFRAHCGGMWVDLAMSNHYMYRSRRHLMKLHCRYDHISPVWPKSCIRISGLQKGHAMMFRAQPGVIWLDIVMAKYYRHSLRRHLIKLHPRNDQITIVRSAIQVSFLHFDDDIHKKIDRRTCQAKQPRVDAICGRKWWLSHSCHHQCDGSIVCPTGAVVLSRLFVHSGEPCSWLGSYNLWWSLLKTRNFQKYKRAEPFCPWPKTGLSGSDRFPKI